MATVWRATHLALGRPVAIKFLRMGLADADALADRFLREARVAAGIRHRNVVDVVDFGTAENGQRFMVMELLEGESLADRMRRLPPADLHELVQIFAQVLSGLAAVHEAGIVHRDLKPENVFLANDADGTRVKLLDFGVSHALVPGHTGLHSVMPAHDGAITGTPQYMSSEQARGMRGLDHRVDLYAVGAMFYETLTGRLPFEDENVADLLVSIVTKPPPALHELRPDLAGPLSDFLAQAMAHDREERFASARAMRRALLEAAKQTAVAYAARTIVEQGGTGASAFGLGNNDDGSEDATPIPLVDRSEPDDLSSDPRNLVVKALRRVSGSSRIALLHRPASHPPVEVLGKLHSISLVRHPWWVGGTIVAGAAVATALIAGAMREPEPSPQRTLVATPPPIATNVASANERPSNVAVHLNGLPSGASVLLDGVPTTERPLRMPLDRNLHRIEVQVADHEPWQQTHRAVADGEYDVVLAASALAPVTAEEPAPSVEPEERPARSRVRVRRAREGRSSERVFRNPGF